MRWIIVMTLLISGGDSQSPPPLPIMPPMLAEAVAPPTKVLTNTITLGWQEPIDPTVNFYRIYHGTNTGKYYESFDTFSRTNRITVSVTRTWGTRHVFVVVSATTDDLESLPSNEVMFPGYSTNIPITNIVLVVPGPFPATIYTRTNLLSGQWKFFTNITTTNTLMPIDTTTPSVFFGSDRAISIRVP